MTDNAVRTYRYVSDGNLAQQLQRSGMARARSPQVLVAFVVVGLLLGLGASLVANAASLPTYLGRVLLIGLLWGAAWLVVTALVVVVLGVPLTRHLNRRQAERGYPEGSVTEVEMGPDLLVLRRPTRTVSVPYSAVLSLRPQGPFVWMKLRGRLRPELLPRELLPDEAIDHILRSSHEPYAPALGERESTCSTTVPPGWAAHVALLHVRATLTQGRFWIRVAIALALSGLLAALLGRGWLLAGPALAVVSLVLSYTQTRRAIAVVPTGSVAQTQFFEDRFVSSNAVGVTEIRFDDVESADVNGDAVFLTLTNPPRRLALARALVPDDVLQRLRA